MRRATILLDGVASKGLLTAILTGVGIAGIMWIATADADQITYLHPDDRLNVTSVGEILTVDLVALNFMQLCEGPEFEMRFNPLIVQVTGIGIGDFMQQQAPELPYSFSAIDNAAGYLSYSLVMLGPNQSIGSGTVITITFVGQSIGSTLLPFEARYANTGGEWLDVTKTPPPPTATDTPTVTNTPTSTDTPTATDTPTPTATPDRPPDPPAWIDYPRTACQGEPITIHWAASSYAVLYEVEVSHNGGPWTLLATGITSTFLHYSYSGSLAADRFRVRGYNAWGWGGWRTGEHECQWLDCSAWCSLSRTYAGVLGGRDAALRAVREHHLKRIPSGESLVQAFYASLPALAEMVHRDPAARMFLWPAIATTAWIAEAAGR